jgi:hypothetical protein
MAATQSIWIIEQRPRTKADELTTEDFKPDQLARPYAGEKADLVAKAKAIVCNHDYPQIEHRAAEYVRVEAKDRDAD